MFRDSATGGAPNGFTAIQGGTLQTGSTPEATPACRPWRPQGSWQRLQQPV